MSIRKIKRRHLELMNRAVTFNTYCMLTGEYTGSWRRWTETRRCAQRGKR